MDDIIKIPTLQEFRGSPFLDAPIVKEIAEELLVHHQKFADFRDLPIDYLWKAEGGASKGNPRLAQIQKVTGVWTHYTEAQFIIWVAVDHLLALHEGVPQVQRRMVEALTHHELSHLFWDSKNGCAMLRGHEFEGFLDELPLYGDVLPSLREVQKTVQQLPLFGVQGEA